MPFIFGFLSWIANFFVWLGVVDKVRRYINFAAMVVVNTAITAAVFAYAAAVLALLLFVYNKTNYLITYINNMISGAGDEVLTWAMDVIKAFGIWNAFVDVYNVFSVPIISIFVIFAMRLGLNTLHSLQRMLISYSIARM
uniref:Uncharacterized protein n=1 Tax=Inoviridae sp. ctTUL13 TaxID=2825782 RepID=A0A8S5UQD4_9VIRU|nr:MAG TPA: hypothetical protein [Inoviridae sp. ctTUL13]